MGFISLFLGVMVACYFWQPRPPEKEPNSGRFSSWSMISLKEPGWGLPSRRDRIEMAHQIKIESILGTICFTLFRKESDLFLFCFSRLLNNQVESVIKAKGFAM